MNIEFIDKPPPSTTWDHHRRQEVREFAAALKQRPGEWAVWPWPPPSDNASRALASRISTGRYATFAKEFQAVSRRGTVYIRYREGGK